MLIVNVPNVDRVQERSSANRGAFLIRETKRAATSLKETAWDDDDILWEDDRIQIHPKRLFFAIHDP